MEAMRTGAPMIEKPWIHAAHRQEALRSYMERTGGSSPEARSGREFAARLLRRAATYWVAPDLTDLVWHTAKSIPHQPLLQTDVPAESGLILWAEPFLRPIAWEADETGCVVMILNPFQPPSPARLRQHNPALPDHLLTVDGCVWFPSILRLCWGFDGFSGQAEDLYDTRACYLGRGRDYSDVIVTGWVFLWVLEAFWALIGQRLTVEDREPAPRALRRKAARTDRVVPEIRIIRLRRSSAQDGSAQHGTVEWTHRWIVGGHWRRQWRPSVKTHRLTWIAPYMKGPADKPLAIRKQLYVVDR